MPHNLAYSRFQGSGCGHLSLGLEGHCSTSQWLHSSGALSHLCEQLCIQTWTQIRGFHLNHLIVLFSFTIHHPQPLGIYLLTYQVSCLESFPQLFGFCCLHSCVISLSLSLSLSFFGHALCNVWNLSSPTRDQPIPPALKAQSRKQWTTRKVPA